MSIDLVEVKGGGKILNLYMPSEFIEKMIERFESSVRVVTLSRKEFENFVAEERLVDGLNESQMNVVRAIFDIIDGHEGFCDFMISY